MSEFWVRKDRKVIRIDKELGDLFLGVFTTFTECKKALPGCSEYVGVISIFVFKDSKSKHGENKT